MDINPEEFTIRFWGVRGSIPCPGPETLWYGGNTPCVEMRVGGKLLIFDGGTGLRMLGRSLSAQAPITAYLFFSHLHWDHIQGLPFFEPAFRKGNTLFLYGRVGDSTGLLDQYLIGQMQDPHFPIPMAEMKADLRFVAVNPGTPISFDDIIVRTASLNHPGGAIGYRVEWRGRSAAYVTDTEHYADRLDARVLELARNADVLIYDAMYTDEEYNAGRKGWGHSTWQEAVKMARTAEARRLVLFHHDPAHDDAFLSEIRIQAKIEFANCFVAREGQSMAIVRPRPSVSGTP